MFRFDFWSPVWYYEPTAKFPAPNFLPAMHIGIASEHGDHFTYKVWTTPNNRWEDGQELIRDIVTMRDHADMSPRVDYKDESLTLSRTPVPTKTTKRKRDSPEGSNISTTISKKKKRDTPAANDDTDSSNNDERANPVVRFSYPLVTERTETGEKG